MAYFFAALLRNLIAGARLALFMRVRRDAFRLDVTQVVAMFVVSALVDMVLDGLRAEERVVVVDAKLTDWLSVLLVLPP